jgi:hypothetical protein
MRADGSEQEYVPDMDAVRHFIPVLEPDSTGTITFQAPDRSGVYPYVCTYPGHGVVMYGAMYVSEQGEEAMPPLDEDPYVPPESLRVGRDPASATAHPYPTTPPIMYRTFMPDSSPASIAVGLRGGISYVFDTVPVTVRYAWKGGFVDNSEVFKGHVANQQASLEGEIFYRTDGVFPLRLGDRDTIPTIEFEGYRLENGRPEFRYTMNEQRVTEQILPASDTVGLQRTFSLEEPEEEIRYIRQAHERLTVTASTGEWTADTLRLSPTEARQFTVAVTE